MLELKGIHKTFYPGSPNEKRALNGIDLTLEDGDFVTIIGGNGAGKSTMLNAIAGVWPIDSGSVLIDGVDVTHLPEHKRAAFNKVYYSRHVICLWKGDFRFRNNYTMTHNGNYILQRNFRRNFKTVK